MPDLEREKRAAAEAAAALVEPRSRLGLGTGSTVAYLLPALAARDLALRCVATSPATAARAGELGLRVEPFGSLARLDLAIDGADQIAPSGWLVKGGGGAHTREKAVAASAERFVVIASSNKPVASLSPPVPLELGADEVDVAVKRLGAIALRDAPPTPDRGVLADYLGPVGDPARLAARLAATPGVVEHGLFPPELVSEILIGRGSEVERIVIA